MRVLSVNVGMPRDVPWLGEIVRTAIFKSPVTDKVPLRTLKIRVRFPVGPLSLRGSRSGFTQAECNANLSSDLVQFDGSDVARKLAPLAGDLESKVKS